jgi:hypothetical protein
VLRACGVEFDGLRRDVLNYVDYGLANLVARHGDDAKPTAGFQRALQGAAIDVQASDREEVDGAHLLVAMFAERESHAVFFLQNQNITRFDLVNYINCISHGSGVSGMRGRPPGGGPGEGVQRRERDVRGPTAASYSPSARTGRGVWGPLQDLNDRLAFLKAELEISDTQEQLWQVFAEALRDFLKARPRPGTGSREAEASGLPERLAIRERDLASDLASTRESKAIVEAFCAGLTEEQQRGADQLLSERSGVRKLGRTLARKIGHRRPGTSATRSPTIARPVARPVEIEEQEGEFCRIDQLEEAAFARSCAVGRPHLDERIGGAVFGPGGAVQPIGRRQRARSSGREKRRSESGSAADRLYRGRHCEHQTDRPDCLAAGTAMIAVAPAACRRLGWENGSARDAAVEWRP